MPETNTGLVQFQELPAIAAGAPEILQKNTNLLRKAIDAGQVILDTIEAEGMSEELDAAANKYMADAAKAVDVMYSRRSPITKMLTAISKEFTGQEALLDKLKSDTIPYKVQSARNDYARKVLAEQRRKEQELRNKQMADQEKIDVVARVELTVREKYNSILFSFKKKYNDLFNSLTTENASDIKEQLGKVPLSYPRDKFLEIACPVTANYLLPVDLTPIVYSTKEGLYDELNANFRENMEGLKMHLQDQIPARLQELADIAKASKAEQERLRKSAELRQRENELALEQEQARKDKEALETATVNREVGVAQNLFEANIAQVEIDSEQTAAVKKFYIIEVLTKAGWIQIINYWFEKCATSVPHDKFGGKKLEAMKKDLETLAYSSNARDRISDSQHLRYVEDVKALTRKATSTGIISPNLNA